MSSYIFVLLMMAFIFIYMLSNWGVNIYIKIAAMPFLAAFAGLVVAYESSNGGSFSTFLFSSFTTFLLTAILYPFFYKKFKRKGRSQEERDELKKFISSNFK